MNATKIARDDDEIGRHNIPSEVADIALEACLGLVDSDAARATETLLRLVQSKRVYVFEKAVELLSERAPGRLVIELLRRLPEAEWNFRSRALSALRTHKQQTLIELASHSDMETRREACLQLSFLASGASQIEAAIASLLDDSQPQVRHAAALAAGRLDLRRLFDAVLALAESDSSSDWPIKAVGEFRDARAIPLLLERATRPGHTQRATIEVLRLFPPSHAIEDALLGIVANADTDLRIVAVDTLSHVGSARAVSVLQTFLDKDVRKLTKRWRKDMQHRLPVIIEKLRHRQRQTM